MSHQQHYISRNGNVGTSPYISEMDIVSEHLSTHMEDDGSNNHHNNGLPYHGGGEQNIPFSLESFFTPPPTDFIQLDFGSRSNNKLYTPNNQQQPLLTPHGLSTGTTATSTTTNNNPFYQLDLSQSISSTSDWLLQYVFSNAEVNQDKIKVVLAALRSTSRLRAKLLYLLSTKLSTINTPQIHSFPHSTLTHHSVVPGNVLGINNIDSFTGLERLSAVEIQTITRLIIPKLIKTLEVAPRFDLMKPNQHSITAPTSIPWQASTSPSPITQLPFGNSYESTSYQPVSHPYPIIHNEQFHPQSQQQQYSSTFYPTTISFLPHFFHQMVNSMILTAMSIHDNNTQFQRQLIQFQVMVYRVAVLISEVGLQQLEYFQRAKDDEKKKKEKAEKRDPKSLDNNGNQQTSNNNNNNQPTIINNDRNQQPLFQQPLLAALTSPITPVDMSHHQPIIRPHTPSQTNSDGMFNNNNSTSSGSSSFIQASYRPNQEQSSPTLQAQPLQYHIKSQLAKSSFISPIPLLQIKLLIGQIRSIFKQLTTILTNITLLQTDFRLIGFFLFSHAMCRFPTVLNGNNPPRNNPSMEWISYFISRAAQLAEYSDQVTVSPSSHHSQSTTSSSTTTTNSSELQRTFQALLTSHNKNQHTASMMSLVLVKWCFVLQKVLNRDSMNFSSLDLIAAAYRLCPSTQSLIFDPNSMNTSEFTNGLNQHQLCYNYSISNLLTCLQFLRSGDLSLTPKELSRVESFHNSIVCELMGKTSAVIPHSKIKLPMVFKPLLPPLPSDLISISHQLYIRLLSIMTLLPISYTHSNQGVVKDEHKIDDENHLAYLSLINPLSNTLFSRQLLPHYHHQQQNIGTPLSEDSFGPHTRSHHNDHYRHSSHHYSSGVGSQVTPPSTPITKFFVNFFPHIVNQHHNNHTHTNNPLTQQNYQEQSPSMSNRPQFASQFTATSRFKYPIQQQFNASSSPLSSLTPVSTPKQHPMPRQFHEKPSRQNKNATMLNKSSSTHLEPMSPIVSSTMTSGYGSTQPPFNPPVAFAKLISTGSTSSLSSLLPSQSNFNSGKVSNQPSQLRPQNALGVSSPQPSINSIFSDLNSPNFLHLKQQQQEQEAKNTPIPHPIVVGNQQRSSTPPPLPSSSAHTMATLCESPDQYQQQQHDFTMNTNNVNSNNNNTKVQPPVTTIETSLSVSSSSQPSTSLQPYTQLDEIDSTSSSISNQPPNHVLGMVSDPNNQSSSHQGFVMMNDINNQSMDDLVNSLAPIREDKTRPNSSVSFALTQAPTAPATTSNTTASITSSLSSLANPIRSALYHSNMTCLNSHTLVQYPQAFTTQGSFDYRPQHINAASSSSSYNNQINHPQFALHLRFVHLFTTPPLRFPSAPLHPLNNFTPQRPSVPLTTVLLHALQTLLTELHTVFYSEHWIERAINSERLRLEQLQSIYNTQLYHKTSLKQQMLGDEDDLGDMNDHEGPKLIITWNGKTIPVVQPLYPLVSEAPRSYFMNQVEESALYCSDFTAAATSGLYSASQSPQSQYHLSQPTTPTLLSPLSPLSRSNLYRLTSTPQSLHGFNAALEGPNGTPGSTTSGFNNNNNNNNNNNSTPFLTRTTSGLSTGSNSTGHNLVSFVTSMSSSQQQHTQHGLHSNFHHLNPSQPQQQTELTMSMSSSSSFSSMNAVPPSSLPPPQSLLSSSSSSIPNGHQPTRRIHPSSQQQQQQQLHFPHLPSSPLPVPQSPQSRSNPVQSPSSSQIPVLGSILPPPNQPPTPQQLYGSTLRSPSIFPTVSRLSANDLTHGRPGESPLNAQASNSTSPPHLSLLPPIVHKKFLEALTEGMYIDAKDSHNVWYYAEIITLVPNSHIRVHYDGWQSQYDEDIDISVWRYRIAPLGSVVRERDRRVKNQHLLFDLNHAFKNTPNINEIMQRLAQSSPANTNRRLTPSHASRRIVGTSSTSSQQGSIQQSDLMVPTSLSMAVNAPSTPIATSSSQVSGFTMNSNKNGNGNNNPFDFRLESLHRHSRQSTPMHKPMTKQQQQNQILSQQQQQQSHIGKGNAQKEHSETSLTLRQHIDRSMDRFSLFVMQHTNQQQTTLTRINQLTTRAITLVHLIKPHLAFNPTNLDTLAFISWIIGSFQRSLLNNPFQTLSGGQNDQGLAYAIPTVTPLDQIADKYWSTITKTLPLHLHPPTTVHNEPDHDLTTSSFYHVSQIPSRTRTSSLTTTSTTNGKSEMTKPLSSNSPIPTLFNPSGSPPAPQSSRIAQQPFQSAIEHYQPRPQHHISTDDNKEQNETIWREKFNTDLVSSFPLYQSPRKATHQLLTDDNIKTSSHSNTKEHSSTQFQFQLPQKSSNNNYDIPPLSREFYGYLCSSYLPPRKPDGADIPTTWQCNNGDVNHQTHPFTDKLIYIPPQLYQPLTQLLSSTLSALSATSLPTSPKPDQSDSLHVEVIITQVWDLICSLNTEGHHISSQIHFVNRLLAFDQSDHCIDSNVWKGRPGNIEPSHRRSDSTDKTAQNSMNSISNNTSNHYSQHPYTSKDDLNVNARSSNGNNKRQSQNNILPMGGDDDEWDHDDSDLELNREPLPPRKLQPAPIRRSLYSPPTFPGVYNVLLDTTSYYRDVSELIRKTIQDELLKNEIDFANPSPNSDQVELPSTLLTQRLARDQLEKLYPSTLSMEAAAANKNAHSRASIAKLPLSQSFASISLNDPTVLVQNRTHVQHILIELLRFIMNTQPRNSLNGDNVVNNNTTPATTPSNTNNNSNNNENESTLAIMKRILFSRLLSSLYGIDATIDAIVKLNNPDTVKAQTIHLHFTSLPLLLPMVQQTFTSLLLLAAYRPILAPGVMVKCYHPPYLDYCMGQVLSVDWAEHVCCVKIVEKDDIQFPDIEPKRQHKSNPHHIENHRFTDQYIPISGLIPICHGPPILPHLIDQNIGNDQEGIFKTLTTSAVAKAFVPYDDIFNLATPPKSVHLPEVTFKHATPSSLLIQYLTTMLLKIQTVLPPQYHSSSSRKSSSLSSLSSLHHHLINNNNHMPEIIYPTDNHSNNNIKHSELSRRGSTHSLNSFISAIELDNQSIHHQPTVYHNKLQHDHISHQTIKPLLLSLLSSLKLHLASSLTILVQHVEVLDTLERDIIITSKPQELMIHPSCWHTHDQHQHIHIVNPTQTKVNKNSSRHPTHLQYNQQSQQNSQQPHQQRTARPSTAQESPSSRSQSHPNHHRNDSSTQQSSGQTGSSVFHTPPQQDESQSPTFNNGECGGRCTRVLFDHNSFDITMFNHHHILKSSNNQLHQSSLLQRLITNIINIPDSSSDNPWSLSSPISPSPIFHSTIPVDETLSISFGKSPDSVEAITTLLTGALLSNYSSYSTVTQSAPPQSLLTLPAVALPLPCLDLDIVIVNGALKGSSEIPLLSSLTHNPLFTSTSSSTAITSSRSVSEASLSSSIIRFAQHDRRVLSRFQSSNQQYKLQNPMGKIQFIYSIPPLQKYLPTLPNGHFISTLPFNPMVSAANTVPSTSTAPFPTPFDGSIYEEASGGFIRELAITSRFPSLLHLSATLVFNVQELISPKPSNDLNINNNTTTNNNTNPSKQPLSHNVSLQGSNLLQHSIDYVDPATTNNNQNYLSQIISPQKQLDLQFNTLLSGIINKYIQDETEQKLLGSHVKLIAKTITALQQLFTGFNPLRPGVIVDVQHGKLSPDAVYYLPVTNRVPIQQPSTTQSPTIPNASELVPITSGVSCVLIHFPPLLPSSNTYSVNQAYAISNQGTGSLVDHLQLMHENTQVSLGLYSRLDDIYHILYPSVENTPPPSPGANNDEMAMDDIDDHTTIMGEMEGDGDSENEENISFTQTTPLHHTISSSQSKSTRKKLNHHAKSNQVRTPITDNTSLYIWLRLNDIEPLSQHLAPMQPHLYNNSVISSPHLDISNSSDLQSSNPTAIDSSSDLDQQEQSPYTKPLVDLNSYCHALVSNKYIDVLQRKLSTHVQTYRPKVFSGLAVSFLRHSTSLLRSWLLGNVLGLGDERKFGLNRTLPQLALVRKCLLGAALPLRPSQLLPQTSPTSQISQTSQTIISPDNSQAPLLGMAELFAILPTMVAPSYLLDPTANITSLDQHTPHRLETQLLPTSLFPRHSVSTTLVLNPSTYNSYPYNRNGFSTLRTNAIHLIAQLLYIQTKSIRALDYTQLDSTMNTVLSSDDSYNNSTIDKYVLATGESSSSSSSSSTTMGDVDNHQNQTMPSYIDPFGDDDDDDDLDLGTLMAMGATSPQPQPIVSMVDIDEKDDQGINPISDPPNKTKVEIAGDLTSLLKKVKKSSMVNQLESGNSFSSSTSNATTSDDPSSIDPHLFSQFTAQPFEEMLQLTERLCQHACYWATHPGLSIKILATSNQTLRFRLDYKSMSFVSNMDLSTSPSSAATATTTPTTQSSTSSQSTQQPHHQQQHDDYNDLRVSYICLAFTEKMAQTSCLLRIYNSPDFQTCINELHFTPGGEFLPAPILTPCPCYIQYTLLDDITSLEGNSANSNTKTGSTQQQQQQQHASFVNLDVFTHHHPHTNNDINSDTTPNDNEEKNASPKIPPIVNLPSFVIENTSVTPYPPPLFHKLFSIVEIFNEIHGKDGISYHYRDMMFKTIILIITTLSSLGIVDYISCASFNVQFDQQETSIDALQEVLRTRSELLSHSLTDFLIQTTQQNSDVGIAVRRLLQNTATSAGNKSHTGHKINNHVGLTNNNSIDTISPMQSLTGQLLSPYHQLPINIADLNTKQANNFRNRNSMSLPSLFSIYRSPPDPILYQSTIPTTTTALTTQYQIDHPFDHTQAFLTGPYNLTTPNSPSLPFYTGALSPTRSIITRTLSKSLLILVATPTFLHTASLIEFRRQWRNDQFEYYTSLQHHAKDSLPLSTPPRMFHSSASSSASSSTPTSNNYQPPPKQCTVNTATQNTIHPTQLLTLPRTTTLDPLHRSSSETNLTNTHQFVSFYLNQINDGGIISSHNPFVSPIIKLRDLVFFELAARLERESIRGLGLYSTKNQPSNDTTQWPLVAFRSTFSESLLEFVVAVQYAFDSSWGSIQYSTPLKYLPASFSQYLADKSKAFQDYHVNYLTSSTKSPSQSPSQQFSLQWALSGILGSGSPTSNAQNNNTNPPNAATAQNQLPKYDSRFDTNFPTQTSMIPTHALKWTQQCFLNVCLLVDSVKNTVSMYSLDNYQTYNYWMVYHSPPQLYTTPQQSNDNNGSQKQPHALAEESFVLAIDLNTGLKSIVFIDPYLQPPTPPPPYQTHSQFTMNQFFSPLKSMSFATLYSIIQSRIEQSLPFYQYALLNCHTNDLIRCTKDFTHATQRGTRSNHDNYSQHPVNNIICGGEVVSIDSYSFHNNHLIFLPNPIALMYQFNTVQFDPRPQANGSNIFNFFFHLIKQHHAMFHYLCSYLLPLSNNAKPLSSDQPHTNFNFPMINQFILKHFPITMYQRHNSISPQQQHHQRPLTKSQIQLSYPPTLKLNVALYEVLQRQINIDEAVTAQRSFWSNRIPDASIESVLVASRCFVLNKATSGVYSCLNLGVDMLQSAAYRTMPLLYYNILNENLVVMHKSPSKNGKNYYASDLSFELLPADEAFFSRHQPQGQSLDIISSMLQDFALTQQLTPPVFNPHNLSPSTSNGLPTTLTVTPNPPNPILRDIFITNQITQPQIDTMCLLDLTYNSTWRILFNGLRRPMFNQHIITPARIGIECYDYDTPSSDNPNAPLALQRKSTTYITLDSATGVILFPSDNRRLSTFNGSLIASGKVHMDHTPIVKLEVPMEIAQDDVLPPTPIGNVTNTNMVDGDDEYGSDITSSLTDDSSVLGSIGSDPEDNYITHFHDESSEISPNFIPNPADSQQFTHSMDTTRPGSCDNDLKNPIQIKPPPSALSLYPPSLEQTHSQPISFQTPRSSTNQQRFGQLFEANTPGTPPIPLTPRMDDFLRSTPQQRPTLCLTNLAKTREDNQQKGSQSPSHQEFALFDLSSQSNLMQSSFNSISTLNHSRSFNGLDNIPSLQHTLTIHSLHITSTEGGETSTSSSNPIRFPPRLVDQTSTGLLSPPLLPNNTSIRSSPSQLHSPISPGTSPSAPAALSNSPFSNQLAAAFAGPQTSNQQTTQTQNNPAFIALLETEHNNHSTHTAVHNDEVGIDPLVTQILRRIKDTRNHYLRVQTPASYAFRVVFSGVSNAGAAGFPGPFRSAFSQVFSHIKQISSLPTITSAPIQPVINPQLASHLNESAFIRIATMFDSNKNRHQHSLDKMKMGIITPEHLLTQFPDLYNDQLDWSDLVINNTINNNNLVQQHQPSTSPQEQDLLTPHSPTNSTTQTDDDHHSDSNNTNSRSDTTNKHQGSFYDAMPRLFDPVPNGTNANGANRDLLLPSTLHGNNTTLQLYYTLGTMIGVGLRTHTVSDILLPQGLWASLLQQNVRGEWELEEALLRFGFNTMYSRGFISNGSPSGVKHLIDVIPLQSMKSSSTNTITNPIYSQSQVNSIGNGISGNNYSSPPLFGWHTHPNNEQYLPTLSHIPLLPNLYKYQIYQHVNNHHLDDNPTTKPFYPHLLHYPTSLLRTPLRLLQPLITTAEYDISLVQALVASSLADLPLTYQIEHLVGNSGPKVDQLPTPISTTIIPLTSSHSMTNTNTTSSLTNSISPNQRLAYNYTILTMRGHYLSTYASVSPTAPSLSSSASLSTAMTPTYENALIPLSYSLPTYQGVHSTALIPLQLGLKAIIPSFFEAALTSYLKRPRYITNISTTSSLSASSITSSVLSMSSLISFDQFPLSSVLTTKNWSNLICGQQSAMDLDFLKAHTVMKRVLIPTPDATDETPPPITITSVSSTQTLSPHSTSITTETTLTTTKTYAKPVDHPTFSQLDHEEQLKDKSASELQLISWLFEILEESSQQDQSTFLQFVWGVSTLPSVLTSNFTIMITDHQYHKVDIVTDVTIEKFRMNDANLSLYHQIEHNNTNNNSNNTIPTNNLPLLSSKHSTVNSTSYTNLNDRRLPTSHTCFFMLDLPLYSSKETLKRSLDIAVMCKTIND